MRKHVTGSTKTGMFTDTSRTKLYKGWVHIKIRHFSTGPYYGTHEIFSREIISWGLISKMKKKWGRVSTHFFPQSASDRKHRDREEGDLVRGAVRGGGLFGGSLSSRKGQGRAA